MYFKFCLWNDKSYFALTLDVIVRQFYELIACTVELIKGHFLEILYILQWFLLTHLSN